mgnify:CR=1 FL=1
MSLTLATSLRSALAAEIAAALDGGSIEIRTGTRPANPGVAAGGTLLATVVLESPAFTESGGVLTLVDPDPVVAAANGTATWCRFLDSGGTAVMDGKVTATGGGGDLTLATTTISTGLTVDVTGGTITMPAGVAD